MLVVFSLPRSICLYRRRLLLLLSSCCCCVTSRNHHRPSDLTTCYQLFNTPTKLFFSFLFYFLFFIWLIFGWWWLDPPHSQLLFSLSPCLGGWLARVLLCRKCGRAFRFLFSPLLFIIMIFDVEKPNGLCRMTGEETIWISMIPPLEREKVLLVSSILFRFPMQLMLTHKIELLAALP